VINADLLLGAFFDAIGNGENALVVLRGGADLTDLGSDLNVGEAVALIEGGDAIDVGGLQSKAVGSVRDEERCGLDAEALAEGPVVEIAVALDGNGLDAIAGAEGNGVGDVGQVRGAVGGVGDFGVEVAVALEVVADALAAGVELRYARRSHN